MQVTIASETALGVLRMSRAASSPVPPHAELRDPDPSPRKRWSAKLLDLTRLGVSGLPTAEHPIHICVSDQRLRLRAKGVRSLVHAGMLPAGAFRDLGDGIFASGPELVFVEYAAEHTLAETCLLGMELCGSYSRDAADPLDGHATMGVPPVTSCARIERFLAESRDIRGASPARRALGFIADNAWSPMEAPVAVMMALPLKEYGYGLGKCLLNVRVQTATKVPGANGKETRVPDILIRGTHVGVNYDGGNHLDLESIEKAAIELGRNPGSSEPERRLQQAEREVRAKAVDDLRRNRDLAAAGYIVFPVVKEDLYARGALDGVVWQLLNVLELQKRKDYSLLRYALESSFAAEERYRLLRSMVSGQRTAPRDELRENDVFIRFDARP